jgi:hypothetical protein
MPTAGLSAAYQALREKNLAAWAKRQRELAEATGKPENIAAVERMIERRMGGKEQNA